MVAAEAAKDHSLQGWRGQQHKGSLTLHLPLTPAGLPFSTKFYKHVVGEDFFKWLPLPINHRAVNSTKTRVFTYTDEMKPSFPGAKLRFPLWYWNLWLMEAASIGGTDRTYLILITHREYILKIQFKIGCSNYSFSNIGDRNSINLSMFGQKTWPGIPNQLEISQANNQPSSCSHSNIHIFPLVVIRLQFWEYLIPLFRWWISSGCS